MGIRRSSFTYSMCMYRNIDGHIYGNVCICTCVWQWPTVYGSPRRRRGGRSGLGAGTLPHVFFVVCFLRCFTTPVLVHGPVFLFFLFSMCLFTVPGGVVFFCKSLFGVVLSAIFPFFQPFL